MKKKFLFLFFVIFQFLVSPVFAADALIQITDIKMAHGIDEKYKPVGVSKNFSQTDKIYCWFEWQGATPNTSLNAKWTYLTNNVQVLDHPFIIARIKGARGMGLSMPEGKKFPPGEYEVQLLQNKEVLKSARFEVLEEKSA